MEDPLEDYSHPAFVVTVALGPAILGVAHAPTPFIPVADPTTIRPLIRMVGVPRSLFAELAGLGVGGFAGSCAHAHMPPAVELFSQRKAAGGVPGDPNQHIVASVDALCLIVRHLRPGPRASQTVV